MLGRSRCLVGNSSWVANWSGFGRWYGWKLILPDLLYAWSAEMNGWDPCFRVCGTVRDAIVFDQVDDDRHRLYRGVFENLPCLVVELPKGSMEVLP